MAEALYGRIAAYEPALARGEAALQAALRRNLYGTRRPGGDPSQASGGHGGLSAHSAEPWRPGAVDGAGRSLAACARPGPD